MFQIDRMGRTPIYEQIIEQTELLIASGVLKPGDQLPSVRALSEMLSANPNTLQKAYAELERAGITTSAPGNGRYIGKDAKSLIRERMMTLLGDIEHLSAKLQIAGIEKQLAIAAVEKGYVHGMNAGGTEEKGQTV
ncbi:MAG TPA: GntR family transcriptional regulator [Candidatus Limiplasma sp.]|nr:GntR family transcriptional regulator [Candidatus Limiplasma sp.]